MPGYPNRVIPKDNAWYVVNITNPRAPRAFNYTFDSEAEVKRAVKQIKKSRKGLFTHLLGAGLIKNNIPIRTSSRFKFRFVKYDYPLGAYESTKKKKWYRSNTRRKLTELDKELLKKRYPELNRLL